MTTKTKSPVRLTLLAIFSLLLLLPLAACGADSATPTPAAKPATTAAAVGTTATGTGSAGSSTTSGGDYTNGKFNLPGTTLLNIDPGLDVALKQLLTSGATAPDLVLQIYASDTETPVLGENADSALTKAGYVFHDVRNGSNSKMIVNNNDGAGAYTKAGGVDVVVYAREATALTGGGTPPGVDATQYDNLINQVNGKQSVLIVLTGTNLFQGLSNTNSTPIASPTQ